MYIWGIFLMLGCLAKSSYACSYQSYESWNTHLTDQFSHGFSGCQGHQYNGIKILSLLNDIIASLDKVAIAALSIDHKGKGLWELNCELSVSLHCKGITGSLLRVKINGHLQLGFDKVCGCQKFIIVDGSLKVLISLLKAPVVDLQLLGLLGILTEPLKSQIAGAFVDIVSLLLIDTLTGVCGTVVDALNADLLRITEEFSGWGGSWSYRVTSLKYIDDGCLTYWSLVNSLTGEAIELIDELTTGIVSGLTSGLIGGSFIGVGAITSLLSSLEVTLPQLTYTVKSFSALGIFSAVLGEVTVAYNHVSQECTSNDDGSWITENVELDFLNVDEKFLSLTVKVQRTLELITGGSEIWFQQGVSEIIEILVSFGGENCGCSGNDALLEILKDLLFELLGYFDKEKGCKDKQTFPNPQPTWGNGNSGSHSCSPHDGCVQC